MALFHIVFLVSWKKTPSLAHRSEDPAAADFKTAIRTARLRCVHVFRALFLTLQESAPEYAGNQAVQSLQLRAELADPELATDPCQSTARLRLSEFPSQFHHAEGSDSVQPRRITAPRRGTAEAMRIWRRPSPPDPIGSQSAERDCQRNTSTVPVLSQCEVWRLPGSGLHALSLEVKLLGMCRNVHTLFSRSPFRLSDVQSFSPLLVKALAKGCRGSRKREPMLSRGLPFVLRKALGSEISLCFD